MAAKNSFTVYQAANGGFDGNTWEENAGKKGTGYSTSNTDGPRYVEFSNAYLISSVVGRVIVTVLQGKPLDQG